LNREAPVYRKVLSWILVLVVSGLSLAQAAPADEQPGSRFVQASGVKSAIDQLGVGEDARVSVKLAHQALLRGYVSQAADESFVVTDPASGAGVPVTYSEVKWIEGKNVATGTQVSTAGKWRKALRTAARIGAPGLPVFARPAPSGNSFVSKTTTAVLLAGVVAVVVVLFIINKSPKS
jgi:hypothetical protein